MTPRAGKIAKRLKDLAKTFIIGDIPENAWRKDGEFDRKRWKKGDIKDDNK